MLSLSGFFQWKQREISPDTTVENLMWCRSRKCQMQKCYHPYCRMPTWLIQEVQLCYLAAWGVWHTSSFAQAKPAEFHIAAAQFHTVHSPWYTHQGVPSWQEFDGQLWWASWVVQKHFQQPEFQGWAACSWGAMYSFVIRFTEGISSG